MMTDVKPIQRSVRVPLDPERAFELFTAQMQTWWPVDTHSRAATEFEDDGLHVVGVDFEGRVGGQVLERMSDGRVLPWAEIVGWDPPSRFVMAWKPHSRPQPPTEVEVRFVDDGAGGTLVELEHRAWERLSEPIAPELHANYASGWAKTLQAFAAGAEREVA
jgi:hypothetical protein